MDKNEFIHEGYEKLPAVRPGSTNLHIFRDFSGINLQSELEHHVEAKQLELFILGCDKIDTRDLKTGK